MTEQLTITAYFNSFMKLLEEHYISPEQIDAVAIRALFDEIPPDTADPTYLLKCATNISLMRLNKHSFYRDAPVASFHDDGTPRIALLPQGEMKDERIAYISIPSADSVNRKSGLYPATGLAILDVLMAKNPLGAIIDLRDNTGGDCYQMVAAIAPLLDEGNLVNWVGRDGKPFGMGVKWDHIVRGFIGGDEVMRFSSVCEAVSNQTLPIAILQGPKTASSGEITALAFRGSPLSRSFGQVTAGYTTCNTSFPLPFKEILGGGVIALTTGNLSDRTSTIFNGNGIEPDVPCDNPMERAIEWIRSFPR